MLPKRVIVLVLSATMLLSMLVGAPAVAQEVPDDAVDWNASSNFDKVLVESDIGEPMTMDIASDGRIFMTDRGGVLRIHDQETGETTIAADIDTYSTPHYPGGNNEGGLLGVALDPDFDDNQWIYLYYSDPVPDGDRGFLSRFEMDGNELDLASEIVLLEVPSQRETCCHLAGDLKFSPDGDLYLSIGDETLANCADQYAPINEDPDFQWAPWCDAQGTAGDTSDLRGKILRITPIDDPAGEPGPGATYEVPDDNLFTSGQYDHLFPDGEYDPELARPEIYVMGARNPFRMGIDPETGWLYYGMYGPNNPQWNDERGPMGFDQWHQVREASNQGWPFCTGNLYPYRPWDFAANEPKGDWFDCEGGPENTSPNNDGLTTLPPVQPATIYYPTNWGTYPYEVPEPFLNLGTGAGGPNSGPIYRYDEELESDTKFPEHFDGRWFLLDGHRDHLKTVVMDDEGDLVDIEHFMDSTGFAYPHHAMFGPNGSLYLIEYGNSGGFQANPDAALYRIDWLGPTDEDVVDECYETIVSDPFDGDALDRDIWPEIVREDPDGYRVDDGVLVIDTLVGDMIINAGTPVPTGQNLIMQPVPDDTAWQATTDVSISPTGPHHHAGFVVYGDDGNFIKASLAHSGNFEFLLHEDGELVRTPGDVHSVPGGHPGEFQVRLTSDGTDVSISYSIDDGASWTEFGIALPLPDDAHVALYAARGPNQGDVIEAYFDWFELGVASASGPDDDFDGDELNRCIWPRIVRHDPDGYSVGDGSLSISTLLGDMIINQNTPAPTGQNLIMQPLPDGVGWEATTEITVETTEQHQQAGFVVYGDDQNFIKAAIQHTGNFEFLLHEDGELVRTDGDVHAVPGGHPGTYQVRLTSNGATVSIAYSVDDGDSWTEFGSALPLPDDPYIALYAARGPNEGEVVDADFQWFTLDEHEPVCPDPDPVETPEGFVPLYDGETLDGWTMAGPGGFEIDPCGLLQPWGGMGLLWYEEEQFENYVLQTEFRVQDPADNSGVFVRFPDPAGDPWNPVDEGFEIQIYEATEDPMGWTGAVYTFAPAEPLATNDLGEWNTMQIEVVDQDYTVTVNDVEVATYTNEDDSRGQGGYVGLQNHAAGQGPGDGVEFRGVWIQDLDDPDDPDAPTVEASLDPADPDGDDDWYVSPVTLTIEADLADADIEWRTAGEEEWTSYDAPVIFDSDGIYDLEYRASVGDDDPGNGDDPGEETVVTAGLPGSDVFVPDEVTVELGETVVFEAGTAGHDVVIDNSYGDRVGAGGDFGSTWVYEFTPDATGMYAFRCQPHQGMTGTIEVLPAGNGGSTGGPQGTSEIGEVSFGIDQTPPETEATLDGDTAGDVYVGEVTLTLEASDATSGVAQTHWREVDAADHETYGEPLVFDEPGTYTLEFRSQDEAGNLEDWQPIGFEIAEDDGPVDPDAPSITIGLDPAEPDGDDGAYVSPVTVTLSSDDPDAVLEWRTAGDDSWIEYAAPVVFDVDGTYELEARASGEGGVSEIATVSFTIDAGDEPPPPPPGEVCSRHQGGATFPDAPGSGHRPFIDCLAELGIVEGHVDGLFRPANDVSRGQLASFVVRAIETATGETMPVGGPSFSDVGAGSTHGEAIIKLRNAGIIQGYEDGTFRPTQSVTRDQTARYVVNALESVIGRMLPRSGVTFPDVGSSRYESDIDALVTAGVVWGYEDGTFGPRQPVTRGQMTRFIGNALEVLAAEGAYHGP